MTRTCATQPPPPPQAAAAASVAIMNSLRAQLWVAASAVPSAAHMNSSTTSSSNAQTCRLALTTSLTGAATDKHQLNIMQTVQHRWATCSICSITYSYSSADARFRKITSIH
jgi:hypothetical protein